MLKLQLGTLAHFCVVYEGAVAAAILYVNFPVRQSRENTVYSRQPLIVDDNGVR